MGMIMDDKKYSFKRTQRSCYYQLKHLRIQLIIRIILIKSITYSNTSQLINTYWVSSDIPKDLDVEWKKYMF
jgi:hypothetical protein